AQRVGLRPRFVSRAVPAAPRAAGADRRRHDVRRRMVPALVLTAGLATRPRPLSFARAKAALPVAGPPRIRRILRSLSSAGVLDVVLNLHHLPHTLTRLLGDGAALGMRIRCSWAVPILGSAAGPKRAIPLLSGSTFLIVNGDTLTDLD